jgi:hypothetical protein
MYPPCVFPLWAQEPRGTIQKLSDFLQHPLGPEEKDLIMRHCSFSFMSGVVNYSLVSKEIMDQNRGKFLRKGTRPSSLCSNCCCFLGPILGPVSPCPLTPGFSSHICPVYSPPSPSFLAFISLLMSLSW